MLRKALFDQALDRQIRMYVRVIPSVPTDECLDTKSSNCPENGLSVFVIFNRSDSNRMISRRMDHPSP